MREGGDDVEWVGKALTAVETERVWNGGRSAENGVGGGVGGGGGGVANFEACYFFLTGRQGWRGGGEGSGDGGVRAERVWAHIASPTCKGGQDSGVGGGWRR